VLFLTRFHSEYNACQNVSGVTRGSQTVRRGRDNAYQFQLIVILLLVGCTVRTPLAANEAKGEGEFTGIVSFTGLPCLPGKGSVPPCDGPYPNYEVVVYQEDGVTPVARASTDSKGRFRIDLPEGNYVVYARRFGPTSKTFDVPKSVRIEAGRTTEMEINIDTGIR
jgi:hypothetical protein